MSGIADIVIGANYGDEGKGLMVDYLARSKPFDLCVRFNGGAQAGHTVIDPSGFRHIFHHFGSATFNHVPTYFSRYMIVNPIVFRKEYTELSVYKPICYVDKRCPVTTPWDMIINQFYEEVRGASRHGSCGMGIGSTIDRENNGNIDLHIDDLGSAIGGRKIASIWESYRNIFASKEKDTEASIYNKYYAIINDVAIYEKFLSDVDFFSRAVEVKPLEFNNAIFEGAQGLGLDQFMGAFPNVTRSNTGMRNVLELARESRFDIGDIVYVTRSYLTRHGVGPMESELSFKPDSITDDTNIPNLWQGEIRIGNLIFSKTRKRINLDLASNHIDKLKAKIAITHLDQIDIDTTCSEYISHGPKSLDVKKT